MKEIGLLFSAPMARAMMRPTDPKTQTRRMPAAHNCLVDGHGISAKRWSAMQFDWAGAKLDGDDCIKVTSLNPDNHGTVHRIYPRAEPGDVVWGRETFAHYYRDNSVPTNRLSEDVAYKADGFTVDEYVYGTWKPAIHMPRWAARIVRPIQRMRFERLQDISEADCIAEGCTQNHNGYFWGGPHAVSGLKQMATAISAYRDLWQSINGPDSWAANPMVLVYEFGAPKP
jgi:hypothetical protein